MNDKGFIKIGRTIKDKPWYRRDNTFRVYMDIALNAAWQDFEFNGIPLRKGQFATSVAALAERNGLSVRQVRTALEHLKATNDIEVSTTSKFSIITVITGDEDDRSEEPADNLADKQPDTLSDNRNRSKEKEVKEIEVSEKEAAALPPPYPPYPSFSFDGAYGVPPVRCVSSDTSPGGLREELVKRYGTANVESYEQRFDAWVSRKGFAGDNIDKLRCIARWLEQDGIQKPSPSSFNPDEVMRGIIQRYGNC